MVRKKRQKQYSVTVEGTCNHKILVLILPPFIDVVVVAVVVAISSVRPGLTTEEEFTEKKKISLILIIFILFWEKIGYLKVRLTNL